MASDVALPPARRIAVIRQMPDWEAAFLYKLAGARFRDAGGREYLVPQHDERQVFRRECDVPPTLGHEPQHLPLAARRRKRGYSCAMRISREDLYREIWSEPATTLARVCEGLNVPHPPRGYWARKAAGETMPIPPLPTAGPGDPISWEKGVAILERLPPLELPSPQPKSKGRAGPPQRPARHPLVTAWRGVLEEAAPTETGYMMPRKKNVLDAFVTKAMIRGAAEALDAILIELEMRGHRVQLSPDHYHHRPAVDVAQRPIRNQYDRRPNEWQPGRPTLAYLRNALVGLTLFELTEHVRVRRTGAHHYVRISDLPPMRRYAPQSPDEADETLDMPTGRFVLRAYSPRHDTAWQHEWIERQNGEFVTMVKAIADALEEAVPILLK